MNERDEHKQNLCEIVADKIETDIILTRSSGDRLPSEQHLSEEYEVSRTVIREAFKLLSERGLIDSRVGSGAFVRKPEAQNLSDVVYRIVSMNDIDWGSVYDVRGILEVAAAKKAARFATEDELDQMETILDRLQNLELPQETRNELDFRYHCMIAEASRNPMLSMLIQAMHNVIMTQIESSSQIEGSILNGIRKHARILSSLRQHDVELAELYMLDHITASKEFFLQNETRKKGDRIEDQTTEKGTDFSGEPESV